MEINRMSGTEEAVVVGTEGGPGPTDHPGRCRCSMRSWGESLELLQGTQKRFSFQISRRTRTLDEALPSQWEPVCIETLRDNVASKMTALVQRGAPRDFLDIYHVCARDAPEPGGLLALPAGGKRYEPGEEVEVVLRD